MVSSVYEIVIDGAPFLTNSAPSEGFIDPVSVGGYNEDGETFPADNNASFAKMRANRRYRNLIFQIHAMTNSYIVSLPDTDGTIDTPPSSLTIVFEFEHGDPAILTPDEENEGITLLKEAAIARCVARAMTITETHNTEYYDVTDLTIVSNGSSIPANGFSRLDNFEFGPIADSLSSAEAAITVTKIS